MLIHLLYTMHTNQESLSFKRVTRCSRHVQPPIARLISPSTDVVYALLAPFWIMRNCVTPTLQPANMPSTHTPPSAANAYVLSSK